VGAERIQENDRGVAEMACSASLECSLKAHAELSAVWKLEGHCIFTSEASGCPRPAVKRSS
jgi:hypothetical protein